MTSLCQNIKKGVFLVFEERSDPKMIHIWVWIRVSGYSWEDSVWTPSTDSPPGSPASGQSSPARECWMTERGIHVCQKKTIKSLSSCLLESSSKIIGMLWVISLIITKAKLGKFAFEDPLKLSTNTYIGLSPITRKHPFWCSGIMTSCSIEWWCTGSILNQCLLRCLLEPVDVGGAQN